VRTRKQPNKVFFINTDKEDMKNVHARKKRLLVY
jgi:hypothetical protein